MVRTTLRVNRLGMLFAAMQGDSPAVSRLRKEGGSGAYPARMRSTSQQVPTRATVSEAMRGVNQAPRPRDSQISGSN
jgi:hypothetical protein